MAEGRIVTGRLEAFFLILFKDQILICPTWNLDLFEVVRIRHSNDLMKNVLACA